MSKKLPQIFVSHSRRDIRILDFFAKAFASTGVKWKCMEFEDMQRPQSKEINKQVQNSIATFLLLGPNVKNSDHTQNWIAFEVGLSCAYKKRVWVFEEMGSKINFPIPYVTDYVRYDLDRISFDDIRGIIESYKSGTRKRIGLETECRHCGSIFFAHGWLGAYYCPICRTYSISKK
jgi:predicted Zn-ribbon and HTH transcriptional regulator